MPNETTEPLNTPQDAPKPPASETPQQANGDAGVTPEPTDTPASGKAPASVKAPSAGEKPADVKPEAEAAKAAEASPAPSPDAEAAQEAARAKRVTAGLVQRTRQTLTRLSEMEREAANSQLARSMAQGLKTASATAGKQGRKAGTQVATAGKQSARAVGTFSKTVAWPQIKALGRRIVQRLHPARIALDAQTSILRWHWLLFDRRLERLMFRPTAKPASLATLTVKRAGREAGFDYRPTPRLVFDWAMAAIGDDLNHMSFTDYGAGKGRVLLMAAMLPFARIRGIEFARELQDDAEMNIAQFPRSLMRCRDVDCLLEDATSITPPAGPGVHYFFRPFSRTAFAGVLNKLVSAYRADPQPLYIVLVDGRDRDLVERSGVFHRVRLPVLTWLAAFLFSPYRIDVYRTDALA